MEGYVYIARIIDHGGKFVNGYHKIGLSKQYKVRETQLNSTHLPFDVLMVRVFQTEDMNKLEGLLHLCFEDYRVVKEYDYRRNITTEWFDVSDIDVFNERLDKFIELMGVNELDITKSIDNDSKLTQEEKEIEKERVGKAKSSKVSVVIDGNLFSHGTQKDLFVKTYKYLCDKLGHEQVADFDRNVRVDINEFSDFKLMKSGRPCTVHEAAEIIDLGGSYLWTGLSAKDKKRYVDRVCEHFGVTEVDFRIDE